MMKTLWRREINSRCLGFSHEQPGQFVRSQWQRNEGVSIVYLAYRWLFAVFFLSVWIFSFISARRQNSPTENFLSKWPIYLTNWGYSLCTAQALLGAGLVTHRLVKERVTGFTEDHASMPVVYKVYWLLHTLAVVIAFGITGSYFVVDYDPAVHTLSSLNLLMHAFNSVLMVLDLLVVDHPFRLFHFCWSLLFIVVYFVFTVVYHFSGGTGKHNMPFIYPALNWAKPAATVPIAILGTLSVFVSHVCTWLVVLARRRIAQARLGSSIRPSGDITS
ncbi:protein rolling stone-like [Periplaneta americana]|uniref:protein rolling stone-like n=1 Tax=Periplaneta americana TaxID=6978 RepID=UPI0037E79074